MLSITGTSHEYQADYLQERMQAYQDAYADGEQIIDWVGRVIGWVGGRVATWRAQSAPEGAGYEYDRSAAV